MISSPSPLFGRTVLVAHPWMGSGGSEATTMWAIQALQDVGAVVTLMTASKVDIARMNRIYGCTVEAATLRILRSPRIPGLGNGSHLAHWQNSWFQRQCRKIADRYFLVVSGYNPIDFGRPGVQLIGDYTWSESLRLSLDPDADRLVRHRSHWLRRLYLKAGDWLRGEESRPFPERGDLVLANSDWTRRILAEEVGLPNCPVVFPPVSYGASSTECGAGRARDPWAFVCLGRISPEKRVESAIRILARVRAAGFPVTLAIAGSAENREYRKQIEELVSSHREWVRLAGFLEASARDELLTSSSFGIHTRPAEAFGIAVAEMAGSGCLPFVPANGGPGEIVNQPELRFRGEDEAVEKIVGVLSGTPRLQELREALAVSTARFLPDAFRANFLEELDRFVEPPVSEETPRSGTPRDAVRPKKSLAALRS